MHHVLPNLTLPPSCALEAVGVRLEVHHGLVDFFLRVEHKGTVLDDFLTGWC